MKRKLLLLTSMLFAACNADHSLGSLDSETDASADTGTTSTTPSTDVSTLPIGPGADAQKSGTPGALATWTGYVENFSFGSGSDRIQLAFASDSAGQVSGTVTLGDGTAPPPATDPAVGYPPGMNTKILMPASYLEGSTFTIKTGSLQSNRLRFSIDAVELWAGWCALQAPPSDGSDICVPNWGGESNADQTVCILHGPAGESLPIDCVKWNLCFMSRVCKCSAAGCVANYEESGYKISFDLFLTDGTASGSMKSNVFAEATNVRFVKN